MKLKDKVALVTGAASGIGAAIAIRFAAEGARVAVNHRPGGRHPKEEVLPQIEKSGGRAIAVAADISKRSEVEAMLAQIVSRFGRLDIVVNNAGIQIEKPFLDVADDEWEKVLAVNLRGSFLVSQLAARQMVKQGGGGKLIFISSTHEDIPFPGYTSYCASKGAVRMMMRNLAIELAPHKINVNNVAPGAIITPINRAMLEDAQAKKEALEEIPWKRFGEPHEVAALTAFLASDEADYVTGSTYYIDGGMAQQVTKY